jgi:methylase of polypeptide subunit release factors
VDATLDWIQQSNLPDVTPRILDIGTGCGCLLISILHALPNSTGIGIDLSDAALAVANDNANRLLSHQMSFQSRFRFVQADMLQLDQPHELVKLEQVTLPSDNNTNTILPSAPFTHIVCNPPYLTNKRYQRLSTLAAEPALALIGSDADGLGAYRALAKVLQSNQLLLPRGLLVLEVGRGLAERVENEIFALPDDNGNDVWRVRERRLDKQNAIRCLVLEKCKPNCKLPSLPHSPVF